MRALQQASFEVEGVVDVKAAVAAIARQPPTVFVFSWPSSGGTDLVRLLRGADSSGQMYVVALLEATPGGRDIGPPLAAGVHDVLRRPIVDAELVARVQGPRRLIKWAQSVTRTSVFDLSTAVDVTRLRVWKGMGDLVAADLAQMFGQEVQATEGWPKRFGRDLRGATIPMSLASDKVELRVSIVADPTTLSWLGGTLLGDPHASEATMKDVLRELANTAGGAVKRAALPENITLTTGIPSNEYAVPAQGKGIQSWIMSVDGAKACLAMVGEIRNRDNLRISASNLQEGMVLAHDLRSESGALLVTAGSRLTTTTAERLAQMLGPRFIIEVACAA